MKRVTVDGYHALLENTQGGPELGPTDVCTQCLTGVAAERAAAQAAEDEEHDMLARALQHGSGGGGFYLSNAWLQYVAKWVKWVYVCCLM